MKNIGDSDAWSQILYGYGYGGDGLERFETHLHPPSPRLLPPLLSLRFEAQHSMPLTITHKSMIAPSLFLLCLFYYFVEQGNTTCHEGGVELNVRSRFFAVPFASSATGTLNIHLHGYTAFPTVTHGFLSL